MTDNVLATLAALAARPSTIILRAVDPVGPEVFLRLGDGFAAVTSDGGWKFTQRPRNTSMTQWAGIDPYTMVVPIVLDGYSDDRSVEPVWQILLNIMRNKVGPRNQPAVVQLTCPALPLTWLRWVINGLTPKVEYRRQPDAARSYIEADLTLYQWEPTDLALSVNSASPAQTVVAKQGAASPGSSTRTYAVRSGDTLESIAVHQLGDGTKWRNIATLNGLRDPNLISVGQILKLP